MQNNELKIYKAKTDRYKRINRQKHMKVENFNTISVIDRLNRDKISKNIVELNITINQLDLIGIQKTLYQTKAEYTLFSIVQEVLIKIDDTLKKFCV